VGYARILGSMPLAPGETFDRYVIRALLGEGGMGEVYEAYDSRLERTIALKVLRVDGDAHGDAQTEGAGAHLLREARVAAAFDHPNAVAIYDVGEMNGVPFFAMEFIAGRSLRTYVGAPLVDVERRLRWLIDVACALAAAHARGLVHRDIKPENIMIREDGVVKVVDFGIARRSSGVVPPSTDGMPRSSRGVAGTPVYMAPELMLREPFDGKVDQFSWGVVAYELLTGRLPWPGKANDVLSLNEMLANDPPPAETLNPEISSIASGVVARALSRSADARFPSMEALVAELDPMAIAPVQGSLPRLPSTELATTTAKQVAQSKSTSASAASAGAITGGAVGALLSVFAVWLLLSFIKSDDPPPPPHPPDDSRTPRLDALTTFGVAMQAFHDARIDEAAAAFDRAVELDPSFAAAYLRRALLSNRIEAPVRERFQRAHQLRDRLSERDLVLLEAFQSIMDVAPKPEIAVHHLDAAVKRLPADTELLFFRGKARWFDADWRGASADMDAVLARDPRAAVAWRYKGYSLAFMGDFDGARRAYEACRGLSGDATSCLRDLGKVEETEGRCAEEEHLVRTRIRLEPRSADAYADLATALYGKGAPAGEVMGALDERWKLTSDADSALTTLVDTASLRALAGDFRTTDDTARRWAELLPADADEVAHFQPAEFAAFAAFEAGDRKKAAGIVEDYLVRRAAWPRNTFEPDFSIEAYAIEYRAGAISRATFAERRAAWLAADEHLVMLFGHNRPAERWINAYAFAAETPEDANEALAVLPRFEPLPTTFLRDALVDEAVGRVYLLAGRYAEAIPILRHGAETCTALQAPFFHTWAAFELGRALEATGARDEACGAYATVASRWKSAQPRSLSGERAEERLRALGCSASRNPG